MFKQIILFTVIRSFNQDFNTSVEMMERAKNHGILGMTSDLIPNIIDCNYPCTVIFTKRKDDRNLHCESKCLLGYQWLQLEEGVEVGMSESVIRLRE